MIDVFFYLSLATAVIAWGGGYALSGLWLWIAAPVLMGLIWLYGWLRNYHPMTTVGLVGFTIGAALGALYELPPMLCLVSLLAAVTAWDLDYFNRRLGKQKSSAETQALERNHLLRLLVVWLIAVPLAGMTLLVNLKLSLWAAILVAIVAALGLNRMIKHQRKTLG